MQTKAKALYTVTVELTAKEAYWFKSLVQNDIVGGGGDVIVVREQLFNSLPPFDVLAKQIQEDN